LSAPPVTVDPSLLFETLGLVAEGLSADRDDADNLARSLRTLLDRSMARQATGLIAGPDGLAVVAESGELTEEQRGAHFRLARLAIETRVPVVESREGGDWAAATPLATPDEVLGVVSLGADEPPRPPQPFLVTLGRLMGSALESSRRYSGIRTAAHRLERLNRLTAALTSGADLPAVVGSFAAELRALFQFDRLACGFVNENGDYVELATDPADASWGLGTVVPLIGSGVGHAILEGRTVVAGDILHSHRFIEDMRLLEEGLRSYAIVPLAARGKTLGVVALASKEPHAFDGEALVRLEPLIAHLAIGFDNLHLMTKLRELSITDEVTPLFNHRFFHQMLERELKLCDRYKTTCSIVFIDLDRFKPINDTHGHLRGSHALREVGFLLRTAVRETDYPARYGGDEFVVILPQTDGAGAQQLADKFRELIEGHTFLQEEGINASIGASLGVATYPADASTKAELIRVADHRMYEDKANRKTGR
jgi:diguanylate cyclase (GGDEF)-like protein